MLAGGMPAVLAGGKVGLVPLPPLELLYAGAGASDCAAGAMDAMAISVVSSRRVLDSMLGAALPIQVDADAANCILASTLSA